MNLDYAQVLEACQRGDSQAQEALYKEFAPVLLGMGMRYLHSREDAQDLLHDAFVKILTNIKSVKNPAVLKAWIYRIMYNRIMDHFRERRMLVYLDGENLEWHSDRNTAQEAALDMDRYKVEDVMEALKALPVSYRTVFNMREVEDMEYEDIAKELNITEQTARAHLSYARRLLRQYFEEKTNKQEIS